MINELVQLMNFDTTHNEGNMYVFITVDDFGLSEQCVVRITSFTLQVVASYPCPNIQAVV